jgi:hypothetical protein
MKKEIWFGYLEYLFNKTFDLTWLLINTNDILTSGRKIIGKMINDLYFKFSSAWCNIMSMVNLTFKN